MKDFWESMFKEEKTTWGYEPSDSAILSKDFFLEKDAKEIHQELNSENNEMLILVKNDSSAEKSIESF